MALPSSGGSGGNTSDKNFIAKVEVQADEQSVQETSRGIRDALKRALEGIDLASLSKITENLKQQGVTAQQTALQAEKLKQAIEKTAQAIEKTAQAEEKTAQAKANTAAAQERLNNITARTATQQDRVTASIERAAQATANWELKSGALYQRQLNSLDGVLAKQAQLIQQLNQESVAAAKATEALARAGSQPLTLGNLGQVTGSNFLQNLLSGQGLGAALKTTLNDLKDPVAQIAKGGAEATAAFNALGIAGTGAATSTAVGFAGLASTIIGLLPIAASLGSVLTSAFSDAFASQKEFIFQSGIIQKQLGLTAAEGAKARALLTLIGQQDNVFATITLNQIQASIAALDRVEKGLDKPTAQVANFGKALDQLGISYKTQEGDLKNFVQIVGELGGALEKLPAAQRSLAVQNLAGLFGSDVAKILGFGEANINDVANNAVVVSQQLQKENDALQVQLAKTAAAYTQLEIAATSFLVPLQKQVELIKQEAFLQFATILQGGTPEQKLIDVTAQIERLRQQRLSPFADTKAIDERIALLVETQNNLRNELSHFGDAANQDLEDAAISTDALKDKYKLLDDTLQDAIKAEKEHADLQKQIEKQNEAVTKSFNSQVDALQSTANTYDQFFQKATDLYTKIGALQDKEGKKITIVGAGGVKDLAKQLLDLQINEALFIERAAKADTDVKRLRLEKLSRLIESQRTALGLQPGEATILANVDITVGKSKLSKEDRQKLQEYLAELDKIVKDFVKDSFDTVQSTLTEVLSGATGNQQLYEALLRGGADTLQRYAEQVGLLSTPGFTQSIGESALKAQLLAGAFGDLNDAVEGPQAFDTYAEKLLNFRTDLANLSEFIADPKKLTIPLAIEFGLVSEGDVATVSNAAETNKRFRDALLEGGEFLAPSEIPGLVNEIAGKVQETASAITQQVDAQLASNELLAASTNLNKTKSGPGIIDLILAKYGIKTGEAIEATAEFAIDANVDTTLAQKQADAAARALEKREDARDINAQWNLNVTLDKVDLATARRQIEDLVAALGGAVTPPAPSGGVINPTTAPPKDDTYIPPRAYGGNVNAGQPYSFLEQGLPELYQQYGSQRQFLFVPPAAGNVQGGNATMALLSNLAGRESLAAQPSITYAPSVRQEISIDARGTNEQAVTKAIKRANVADQFRSALPSVRQRDLQRSLGVY